MTELGRSATIDALLLNVMKTQTSSLLSVLFAIAAVVVVPGNAVFAAVPHAAKPVAHKKASSAKKAAAADALPSLAAQTSLAANAPALPAKAWLLMDFDSGEVLASANADEALPPASLTKMMTSYIVEQALRAGKLKTTDLVSVSQNAGSSSSRALMRPRPLPSLWPALKRVLPN
mgnify:CR=1 FL=1